MSDAKNRRTHWDVVLAEDNDDHALLIEMALKKASRHPVELRRARNGDEAIGLIEAELPDLLLLDLKMPGRTGHEVLDRLKNDDRLKKVPIAVLTSSDRDEDIARSYGLGGNHFITKPENPVELETRLRSLLNNLSELRGIRRGAGEIDASARSAIQAQSFVMRRAVAWGMVVAILAALVIFALATGVIGGGGGADAAR
jgi:CheY-like chemotaxis protein